MEKKELLYYDLNAPKWLVEKEKRKSVSLVREVDEEAGIWIYRFYEDTDLQRGEVEPYLVIFKDKHTWINYLPKEKRWGKASFDYLYDSKIYIFFRLLQNLCKWQRKILSRRKVEREKRREERTSYIMSGVPELPVDFEDFCIEEVMKGANYLIYNSKQKKVYCTHCKQEYELKYLIQRNEKKAKHGEIFMCDNCKVELIALSEGMTRGNRNFRCSTELLQPLRKGVIVRIFNLYRNFDRTLEPKTEIEEKQRIVFENGKMQRYELRYLVGNKKHWYQIREGRYFTTTTYVNGMLYGKNLKDVIRNSEYASKGILEYWEKHKPTMQYGYEAILQKVKDKPYVEQFIKAGLDELAERIYEGRFGGSRVDQKQTELVKMLKINRQQFRWLKRLGKQYEALELLQSANNIGRYISETEVRMYVKSACSYKELDFLLKATINTEKACRYMEKENISMNDFIDHLELMKKLEIPMKKQYLYPKNFEKTHQEEIEEDLLKNNHISEKINKQYLKTYNRWKKIAKQVGLQDEEYQIVFPEDCMDIKIEGRILHHCVGGYAERAAKGETVILYMRRKTELQKRLYTMEYRDGRLIQIRGVCNCKPEDDARKLAERFAKEFSVAEARFKYQEQKKKVIKAIG